MLLCYRGFRAFGLVQKYYKTLTLRQNSIIF